MPAVRCFYPSMHTCDVHAYWINSQLHNRQDIES